MPVHNKRIFYLLLGLVTTLDQVFKKLALDHLIVEQTEVGIPGLIGLTLAKNTGAAFSLFSQYTGYLTFASIIFLVCVCVYIHKMSCESVIAMTGWGLIAGGALGNLIDRIVSGEVTDYLQFLFVDFPIFNFADVCINLGVVLIIFDKLKRPVKETK